MSDLLTVLRKEWRCFLGSDRSVLALYAVIVLLWSMLFAGVGAESSPHAVTIWLLPFSVIVVSNFAQSVFVAERLTGSIEIFLTCGVSRGAILGGKMLFVWLLAVVTGSVCMLLGTVWSSLLVSGGAVEYAWQLRGPHVALFAAGAAFNTAVVALLSMLLPNPRMSHFVNFLAIAAVLAVYYPLVPPDSGGEWILAGVLMAMAVVVAVAVFVVARGERLARGVNL